MPNRPLARPGDETVILEAFKIGTEPGRGKQAVVRGETVMPCRQALARALMTAIRI